MAAVRGIHRDYSGLLRKGIGQTLILIALWGDRAVGAIDVGRRADVVVEKLLGSADKRRWWSLSRDYRLLAEAAPSSFLSAVEDSLDQADPQVGVLFGDDDGGLFFGEEHLSDLMWALESLAWSPDWMPRVVHVLARLDAIDVKPRRFSNGPGNSLREIHLLWNPQTYSSLDERLRALDLIRRCEPEPAWKLMLGVLPQGHDSSTPSPLPRWRDFTVDQVEAVTYALIGRGAQEISRRLLADVGVRPERWEQLLDRLENVAPAPDAAIDALDAAERAMTEEEPRSVVWRKLRNVLHHHRQFPSAEWALPAATLGRLEGLYQRFAPTDALSRTAWLFQQSTQLPAPAAKGWEVQQRQLEQARADAAQMFFATHGASGVLSLARLSDVPAALGKALHDGNVDVAQLDGLLKACACSNDVQERDVAHGLVSSLFHQRGETWGAALIAKATAESWGGTALQTLFRAMPSRRWTWDQVAAIGGDVDTQYWKATPVFWINDAPGDIAWAIEKLIEVGRARQSLALACRGDEVQLPTDLLILALTQAARQPEGAADGGDSTMLQHFVVEILGILDKRVDVDDSTLAGLEWMYLPLLEHSSRPPKALLRALSEQPALFVQLLCALFKPSEDSGIVEPDQEDPAQARALASQSFRLLEMWNRLPGAHDDGSIDSKELESWIKEARALAHAAGRSDIADDRIGMMLSASPFGADGVWPAESVRDALDLFRSKAMATGFRVGKSNRRGVTTRMPGDGGQLERREAENYRTWAKAVRFGHPYTAKALDGLADQYDQDAVRHDERAARLDWEM
jgi:hypothetical protein